MHSSPALAYHEYQLSIRVLAVLMISCRSSARNASSESQYTYQNQSWGAMRMGS